MIATKEAVHGSDAQPTPGPVPIMELPFVAQRLVVMAPGSSDRHASDRSMMPVRKWKLLMEQLPLIRGQTIFCLEAAEGKNGVIGFKICDRARWDGLQQSLADHQEQISGLEVSLRELDALNCGWVDEMRSQRDSLSAVENQQRKMLSTWAQSALNKGYNSKLSVEEILSKDQQYQSKKVMVEGQIARAKTALADLVPKLEKVEDILKSVGC